jgi:fatty-acyl-CoA synthase
MDQNLSHVVGAASPPLLDQTIGQALDAAAERWGGLEAVVSVHQSVRWTYAELKTRAEGLAAGFLALGLKPGERIGIWSPNKAEWTLTQFAAAKAGLILVTINPAYRLSEVEYTIGKVGIKALVCAEAFKTSAYVDMIETLAPEIADARPGGLNAQRLPSLSAAIKIGGPARPGWLDFEDVPRLAGEADRAALARVQAERLPHEAINIQFTSGTTGLPKGATLSHRNILNNGFFVGEAVGLRPGDRLCLPVPLYHCFGMVMGNLLFGDAGLLGR